MHTPVHDAQARSHYWEGSSASSCLLFPSSEPGISNCHSLSSEEIMEQVYGVTATHSAARRYWGRCMAWLPLTQQRGDTGQVYGVTDTHSAAVKYWGRCMVWLPLTQQRCNTGAGVWCDSHSLGSEAILGQVYGVTVTHWVARQYWGRCLVWLPLTQQRGNTGAGVRCDCHSLNTALALPLTQHCTGTANSLNTALVWLPEILATSCTIEAQIQLLHFLEGVVLGFCLLDTDNAMCSMFWVFLIFVLWPIVPSIFGTICCVVFQIFIII